jgi:hypothetical protein
MSIRLGDEAPNFTAETTEGTLDFTSGRTATGRFFSATLPTSPR